MLKEKMPKNARMTHCPSCHVHSCCCRDRSVSAGDRDVCSALTEDAGDCLFRSFDLIFLRNLWGTSNCIDLHGI